jgi:hypothetical protein
MRDIRFDRTNKSRLRKASREQIESYFSCLPSRARGQKWLRKKNRYRVSCTATLKKDIAASTVDDTDLREYVAASGPCHVIDSWALLARAVDAGLRGDSYSATHFAYYAELRAAVALLACEGVGVLDRRHPIVLPTGLTDYNLRAERWDRSTQRFGGPQFVGTHAVVWPALQHWSTLNRAGDLLEEVVSPEGIPISEWLRACGAPVPAREIGRRWLRVWGLDLSVIDDDHNARNLASYRPSEFRRPAQLEVSQIVEFVEDLWGLFEPGTQRRFPNVERFLLRRTLRSTRVAAPSARVLESLGLNATMAGEWAEFLGRADDPKPFVFAEQQGKIDGPHCHLNVISRAALLLFLATYVARRLLFNASYAHDTIAFWWEQHGVARGLWEDIRQTDLFDLWSDIQSSLTAARAWRLSPEANHVSLRYWRRAQQSVLEDFGSLELVGIWGLIP